MCNQHPIPINGESIIPGSKVPAHSSSPKINKFVTIQQNTNSSVYKMETIQTNNPNFVLCNKTKKIYI